MGNELVNNVGAGGPGKGRAVYPKYGSMCQEPVKVAPTNTTANRATIYPQGIASRPMKY